MQANKADYFWGGGGWLTIAIINHRSNPLSWLCEAPEVFDPNFSAADDFFRRKGIGKWACFFCCWEGTTLKFPIMMDPWGRPEDLPKHDWMVENGGFLFMIFMWIFFI